MPVRTCIACRKPSDKAGMLRFVAREGRLAVDAGAGLPGRGAYLCTGRRCVDLAFDKKGVFARALRTGVELPDRERILSMAEDA